MSQSAAEQIGQHAATIGLLSDRQLREVWASFGTQSVGVDEFLQVLVRRGLLTNYQVERLLKGDSEGYFYGDYKVLYLMGTGTFARVFRAVHRETGQVVALKVLRRKFSEIPAQYNQFVREGQIGCTLRHPNIVSIYEVYSRGHTHFLVMEFVEGRNLREFMKIRKLFEPAEALPLMTGIASGLGYAFERGLTHRDLKMSNVLVSSKGEAKLVDFGLAALDETLSDEALADMPNARTIDYAALERATGVRKDDARSDIYFLGCIFYHMLTGRPPFIEVRDRVKRLSKARFLEVPPIQEVNPKIPNTLALVVNKAMFFEPNRRYQNPAAVVRDLELAARRLQESPDAEYAPPDAQRLPEEPEAAPEKPRQHTVMVVEPAALTQEPMRNGLKKVGYRVLLTGDPDWALTRVLDDGVVPDCLVIDAELSGEPAFEAFLRLATEEASQAIPALLLLGENQRSWVEKVPAADHRRVMFMPLTMKQVRDAVKQLLATRKDTPADA